MVARGPGDVGCAHCTQIGATQSCPDCTLLICPTCADDWTTCAQRSGRIVQLEKTAVVKDVNPSGHLAVVAFDSPPRILELHRMRWLPKLPYSPYEVGYLRQESVRLTTDGFLIVGQHFLGVTWRHIADARLVVKARMFSPHGATCLSAHEELFVYATDSGYVRVMKHELDDGKLVVRWRGFEPISRKVVHAVHVERDIMISSTWREISIDRIVDNKLEHIRVIDTGLNDNIHWLKFAPGTLALATSGGVEIRRLDDNYKASEVLHRHDGKLTAGAVSFDGRYVALAFDKRLVVHDMQRDAVTELGEHTKQITLVRFTMDHMLISAGNDRRLCIRPRTEAGYAPAVIAAHPQT